MSTLHCTLENGADLYVNERQKIRHYCARSTEERRRRRKRMPNHYFLLRVVHTLNCAIKRCVHSFDLKSAIEHDCGV